MSKPLLVIGSGGHASVLVDILRQQNRDLIGIVSPEMDIERKVFESIPHYVSDDEILNFSSDAIKLVNGIGSLPRTKLRASIYKKFIRLGYKFETIIDSSAIVSNFATLDDGCQIFAGAIIQTGVYIGENTIINSGAIIEHDCFIGSNNHIAPGVTLSGEVETKNGVHIGTGAAVIQGIRIDNKAVIGAGAIVIKNVEENHIFYSAQGSQRK